MTKNYLETLNKGQYEAATTIDGPMLVLAGAGAGKTHTMITRVAHMIDQGIPLSRSCFLRLPIKQQMK